jgi:aminoglycoside/choline kinase family phosphotransferase
MFFMINSELRRASPDVTTHFNFQDLMTAHEQGQPIGDAQMSLIAGDASDRKFYRLASAQLNAICMKFPKWEGGYGGDPMSWLGMQAALLGVGIPVPRILHIDEKNSCIWTEDFGDQFLNYKLGERTLDESDADCRATLQLYKDALNLLVKVQYPEKKLIHHPAENRSFDFEKLMFEMNFFITHFVKGWLGQNLETSNARTDELTEELGTLCTLLHETERVLCHRDYHVRNVMVVGGQVRWIDFQDARMGPHTYDVVSLLRDSYIRITPETRISLTRHYGARLNDARQNVGKKAWSNEMLFHEASLMGLQRNIKALGSFGYLATQKQKTGYLKYVPHTIETILADDFAKEAGMRIADAFPATIGFLTELVQGSGKTHLESKLRSYGVAESF